MVDAKLSERVAEWLKEDIEANALITVFKR